MRKDDVFTFTAPNGVEVIGVVVAIISRSKCQTVAMCYAQNRLFVFYKYNPKNWTIESLAYSKEKDEEEPGRSYVGETLVDYAILPEYDKILKNHQHTNFGL